MISCSVFLKLIVVTFVFSFSYSVFSKTNESHSFYRLPDVAMIKISPDGSKLAGLVQSLGKSSHVFTYDVESKKKAYPLQIDNKDFSLRWLDWVSNDVLLVGAESIYLRAYESKYTRLLRFDIRSKEFENVIPKSYFRHREEAQFQDSVISLIPDKDNYFLLAIDGNKKTNVQNPLKYEMKNLVVDQPSVYRVNAKSKKMVQVQERMSDVKDWIADEEGDLRLAIRRNGLIHSFLYKETKKSTWKKLWDYETSNNARRWPIGIEDKTNRLYFLMNGAVYWLSLSQLDGRPSLFIDHPDISFDSRLSFSGDSKILLGVTSSKRGHLIPSQPALKDLENILSELIPGSSNKVIEFNAFSNRYLVLSQSTTDPGTYLTGTLDSLTVTPIAKRYPKLSELTLPKTSEYTINVSEVYGDKNGALTLPEEKQASMPAIIFSNTPDHFGNEDFNSWDKFFAAQGYTTLRIDISENEFVDEHVVFTAAKEQLVREGLAESDKVCIFASGYAAYAALRSAADIESPYACLITWGAITDLNYMHSEARHYTNEAFIRRKLPETSSERKSLSPIHFTDKIDMPTLVMHGGKDAIFRREHSERLVENLRTSNKQVDYVEVESLSFLLKDNESREQVFSLIGEFLGKHLGEARTKEKLPQG